MNSSPAPLRVVVVATTFPARRGDGTPEFVLTLAEELVRQGVEVTVVAPRVPDSVPAEVINGVRVRRSPYFPRRWEDLAHGAIVPNLRARPSRLLQVLPLLVSLWWLARREAQRTRAQVIHAHWIIPGGLVARALGLPYVVTAHGADAYALSGRLLTPVKKLAAGGASTVVPVSAAIGSRLEALGYLPEPPIPMGVDVGEVEQVVPKRVPVTGRILFVGRLVDKKGADDLVRALRDVPDATLRVAGEGPDRAALEQMAERLGVRDRIVFLGLQTHVQVLREMAEAAVLAMPSKRGAGGDEDGVPVVLPEAIAVGLPVVASDAGGLADHVIDGVTGWTIPAGDASALAAALNEALVDSVRAESRAAAARERILPQFRIDRIGSEYLRVLKEAVGR